MQITEKFDLIIDTKGNKKQKLAFSILLDNKNPVRELGYGGAGGGAKTFTGVARQWIMRNKYPGTRGFFARRTLKSIKESTYISYLEFCEIYKIPKQYRGKFYETKSKIVFPNGSEIIFIELDYKPSDPLYLGLGSTLYTDGFIEEANEIHPKGVEAIQTRVGRRKNRKYGLPSRTFETFNPDKGHVYHRYYLPYKNGIETDRKRFIPALATDNNYLPADYIDNLKSKSKITQERLLYGNFEYDDSIGKLFSYDALQDLKTNPIYNGKFYITCDPARLGRDKAIILVWNGFQIIDYAVYKVCTNDVLQDKIKMFSQKYIIPMRQVIVDEDGVGGGIVDNLKCKGFVNNSSPIDTRTASEKFNGKPKPNYTNLKNQCFFELEPIINQNKINIAVLTPDYQEELIQELDVVRETDIDKDGKKRIISKEEFKKDLSRSPDWADNLAMRMFFELQKPFIAVTRG